MLRILLTVNTVYFYWKRSQTLNVESNIHGRLNPFTERGLRTFITVDLRPTGRLNRLPMERMFHHRRDTPGHVPMTSSLQWSGHLRSTLAELAINESVEESEEAEPANLAKQRREAKRVRDMACLSAKCEPNRPGSARSAALSRRDTPAYVYDKTKTMKSRFNRGVAGSFIPEDETKTEEISMDKQKRTRNQRQKQKQTEEDDTERKTPRRKICVVPTDAPAINHLSETCDGVAKST